ncbi:Nramp-domain-containing protein [Daedalea quercina L-15889]|uniref:Nramp-domain-containing protein n=1 Tax=Daedalea quercina L-15889 TaxID=1314783 RepID=A0A165TCU0_9APHY|nr:Nramp-domain-containing protein [Daedalea quercina L-15889]
MAGASSLTASSGSSPAAVQSSHSRLSNVAKRARTGAAAALTHIAKHFGTVIVCAVAFLDPGNWEVDLQAGSMFGYALLVGVLQVTMMAVSLQDMASRLGVVTGLDLASHCRLLLHDRPKHTRLWRWGALYPLYALSEIAIVATDLAELLGSAIALTLLFPALPLYAGVILTALDVLFLLAVKDPLSGQPVKLFEIIIALMVFTVLITLGVTVSNAKVQLVEALMGFLPSATAFGPAALPTTIGLLGATIMPHSLFLGSALAARQREPEEEEALGEKPEAWTSNLSLAEKSRSIMSNIKAGFSTDSLIRSAKRAFHMGRVPDEERRLPKTHSEHENHSLGFVRRHFSYGHRNTMISLLGLVLVINSLIIILAGTVFFNGGSGSGPATLFDAYDLLANSLGKATATLFAVALLFAGQSSSIIVTLTGQVITEGFLRWKISPVLRRLLIRCVSLIPGVIVAAALGRAGVSTLLVISRVVLSVVLPFTVFPLIWLCSSRKIMSVKRARSPSMRQKNTSQSSLDNAPDTWVEVDVHDLRRSLDVRPSDSQTTLSEVPRRGAVTADPEAAEGTEDFSLGKFATAFGWFTWCTIVAANGYAIASVALGMNSP